jgi:biotin carboxyl carrier protein
MMKYTASIGTTSFAISAASDSELEVNGKVFSYTLESLGGKSFTLILDGRSHVVELLPNTYPVVEDGDGASSSEMILSIRGRQYAVSVDDARSAMLRSLISKSHSEGGSLVVHAPMPGLISRIEVTVGQEVAKGAGLLVLEAMKMENEIRAASSGKVQAIHVERGKPVEKGEVLITLERLKQ